MVRLRLSRIGRKNLPYYYIIAVCSRRPLRTRFLHKLGSYDCFRKVVRLDKKITVKLLKEGARPSTTVQNILRREGVWKEFMDGKQKKKTHVRPLPTSKQRILKQKKKQLAKIMRRKSRAFLITQIQKVAPREVVT